MEGQMVQKTSPLTPRNGHFLFNARIISCFCISEEPLSLKLFSLGMIVMEGQMVQKTSPLTPRYGHCLFNAIFISGFFILEEPLSLKFFFTRDDCYGGSNGTKYARVTWGFWILMNF